MSFALVSVLGRDRIGLVASIADHLFAAGVNLRDASFAVLGGAAEFAAVCELPPSLEAAEIEAGLSRLPDLAGAQVRVLASLDDPGPAERSHVTHRITVSGGDQLGLVARLAEIFAEFDANIVRMEARKLSAAEGGLYVTRFAVSIPSEREPTCLAAVANTAGSLELDCEVEEGGV